MIRSWPLLWVFMGCSVPPVGRAPGAFELPPPPAEHEGVITGTVSDDDGVVLAGAHVVSIPLGHEATTDDQGLFRLPRLEPGTYTLLAAADGFDPLRVDGVEVSAGEQAEANVLLSPAVRVRALDVEVLGPDGAALVGAAVVTDAGLTGTTDADGRVRLEGVAATVSLTITDSAAGMWPRHVDAITVPAAQTVQIALELSGRADDASWVGAASCQSCHTGHYDDWSGTRHAAALTEGAAPVAASFGVGEVVQLGRGSASVSLELVAGEPVIRLIDDVGASLDLPVAGLIGDPSGGTVPWVELGDQAFPAPVGFTADDPDFYDLGDPDWLPAARPAMGQWPDAAARWVPFELGRWLDGSGLLALESDGRPRPLSSAEAVCFGCHATGFSLDLRADGGVDFSAADASGGRWIDAAVSCERCHGPGSAHVSSQAESDITRANKLDASRALEVCGQCHRNTTSNDSGLPYPQHGSEIFHAGQSLDAFGVSTPELWASGAASAPRQQGDELQRSPHAAANGVYGLQCFDCHDPHGGTGLEHQLRLASDDNSLCASCHLGLSFSGDLTMLQAHPDHDPLAPDGPSHRGRCTSCHMPATASLLSFHDSSGAGDLSSHLFVALSPQTTLDVFDLAGGGPLPVGSFPVHACGDCHAYNAWLNNGVFPGPHGDPTLRTSHFIFNIAYGQKFP